LYEQRDWSSDVCSSDLMRFPMPGSRYGMMSGIRQWWKIPRDS
jgi:hypothetical protein